MIKNKIKFIIKLILVILWLLFIFIFSNSNSIETTNQSKGITSFIVENTVKLTNSIHITNIDESEENISNIVSNIHPIIRKLAHYTEYFILAILVLLMIKETTISYYYIFTILFCILIAISDEIHQLFIEGRSGNIIDILIDTSGCLTYILIYKLYNILKSRKVK